MKRLLRCLRSTADSVTSPTHNSILCFETLEPRMLFNAVTIGTENLQDFKGFGLFPAMYDRVTPTFQSGAKAFNDKSWLSELDSNGNPTAPTQADLDLYDIVLGVDPDIARVEFVAETGVAEGVLDNDRLRDLKEHLTIIENADIDKYIVSIWSPPTYMKTPDQVRFGEFQGQVQKLDSSYADGIGYDYADYLLQVIQDLVNSGYDAPLAISIQNEPDFEPDQWSGAKYSGTNADRAMYRNVVKDLRGLLDANGLGGVQIIGPETLDFSNMGAFLGNPINNGNGGFERLVNDAAFDDALDGIAYHTYVVSNNANTIKQYQNALDFHGKDVWQTERSDVINVREKPAVASESPQDPDILLSRDNPWKAMEHAIINMNRMGGDLVDLKANYWFWWRGWRDNNGGTSDSGHIVNFVDQDGANGQKIPGEYEYSKMGHVLNRLWNVVDAGWNLKRVTDTHPTLRSDNQALIDAGNNNGTGAPVDLFAFERPDGQQTVTVLVNREASDTTVNVSGLQGSNATQYLTSVFESDSDMGTFSVNNGTLNNLSLPRYSISVLITDDTGGGNSGGGGNNGGGGGGTGGVIPIIDGGFQGMAINGDDFANAYDGVAAGNQWVDTFGLEKATNKARFQWASPQTIAGVRIAQSYANTDRDLEVEVKANGVWNFIDTVNFATVNAGDFDTYTFANPIANATQVRFTLTEDWFYFDEVEVLAEGSGNNGGGGNNNGGGTGNVIPIIAADYQGTPLNGDDLANAYDGVAAGNQWVDTFGLRNVGNKVRFQWAAPQTIVGVRIAQSYANTDRDLDIEVKVNGVWTFIDTVNFSTVNAGDFDTYTFANPIANATQVRFTLTEEWFYFDEIEVLAAV